MYIFVQMYYVKYVHMFLTPVSGIQNQVASTYSLGLGSAKKYIDYSSSLLSYYMQRLI